MAEYYSLNESVSLNQSGNDTDNYSYMELDEGKFFETYFSVPRFVTETVVGIISAACNILALGAVCNTRGRQSAYHILFFNLAVANILTCILSWICNNVLFLFGDQITQMLFSGSTLCEIFVYLLAGVFATSAFGLVSTLTMLGFSTVQYFAICKPLHHQSIVRKRKIGIFVACTWTVTLIGAFVPFSILLALAKQSDCDAEGMLSLILNSVILGANISVGIMGATYVAIVSMCLRIYAEIRQLQKRLSQFRFDHDMTSERKAFITILILLCTLTIFFIPYAVVFAVSLNLNADSALQSNKSMIYYMNLLPYVKFFSDPIIYGMRMQEVRDGGRRMFIRCGLLKCACCNPQFQAIQQNAPSTTVMSLSNAAVTTL